jgi:HlyD family secretion protein
MKATINKKVIGISAVVVAAAAIGGYFYWGRQASAEEYLTAKVERGSIKNTVAATGTLQAVTTVQVGSQVSGAISALFADFNSTVRKGQVVAQLDPAIFQAQLASARANLESARANLTDAQARVLAAKSVVENQRAGLSGANANLAALRAQRDDAQNQLNRQESLAKGGIVPERDLEAARTTFRSAEARYNQAVSQVEQARLSEQSSAVSGIAQSEAQVKQAQAQVQQSTASVQLAEVNLSHTTISSPIDGVVVSRNVDVGQTVAASLSAPTLFTIANDLTQMQVIANIDQADIGVINQDNRTNFTVDAFPGENFNGSIKQIRLNPQNVQNVVTYNVVIDVKNPQLKLKPGMTANLTMTIAERANVLKIPNAAFRFRPAGMTPEQVRDLVRNAGGNREGKPADEKAPAAEGAKPSGEKPEAKSEKADSSSGDKKQASGEQGGKEGHGEGRQGHGGAPTGSPAGGPSGRGEGKPSAGGGDGAGQAARGEGRQGHGGAPTGSPGGRGEGKPSAGGGDGAGEAARGEGRQGNRGEGRGGDHQVGAGHGPGERSSQGAGGAQSGAPRAEATPMQGFAPQAPTSTEGQRRVVWVLGADKKPQPRRVRVGITDGTATEFQEGDLKEGDILIVGQNVSSENRSSSTQRPPGFGGPGGGIGGGGGRPGGAGGGAPGGARR